MPRYVILAHDWPAPHWDLLCESGGVLKAWRLLAEPTRGATVPAEPNADHRLMYLDYEGMVSGDRGTVTRYAAGNFDGFVIGPDAVEILVPGGGFVLTNSAGGWACEVR